MRYCLHYLTVRVDECYLLGGLHHTVLPVISLFLNVLCCYLCCCHHHYHHQVICFSHFHKQCQQEICAVLQVEDNMPVFYTCPTFLVCSHVFDDDHLGIANSQLVDW